MDSVWSPKILKERSERDEEIHFPDGIVACLFSAFCRNTEQPEQQSESEEL